MNHNKMGFGYHENTCDISLGLGLSTTYEGKFDQNGLSKSNEDHKKPSFKLDHHLQQFTTSTNLEHISLTLGFSDVIEEKDGMTINNKGMLDSSSTNSGLSNSLSNTTKFVKREKELVGFNDEMEVEKMSTRVFSDEDDDGSARKKLRLSKEQSALLEETFKEHSTLNPKRKQALAKKLNLRPRQVEVWFQNRRARTKLKQTELDFELLKKCCETLTEENRRLHKELQGLKGLRVSSIAPPMSMQIPATTLTMCPSCQRLSGGSSGGRGGGANNTQTSFL